MNIRELRESKGLTRAQMAESIGLSISGIAKYEQGKNGISPSVLAKIKEVYGVDIDAVITPDAAPTEEKKVDKKTKKEPEVKAEEAPEKPAKKSKKAEKAPETKEEPKAEKPAKKTKKAEAAPEAKEEVKPEKPAKKAKKADAAEVKEEPKAEKPAKKAKKADAPKAEPAKEAVILIQSPLGGVISPEEIIAKVGDVDTVYVRVDENKAYWVKGEETGDVDLW